MLLKPDGHKWWRLSYRFAGKQKTLSVGVFPDVTLAKARDAAKAQIAQGIDPSIQRQIQKDSLAEDGFEAVARE